MKRSSFRIASFNIERGYNAEAQQRFLADNEFDIVLLQEVDMGCKRTDGKNVLSVLANEVRVQDEKP